jgi:hypothetical protein
MSLDAVREAAEINNRTALTANSHQLTNPTVYTPVSVKTMARQGKRRKVVSETGKQSNEMTSAYCSTSDKPVATATTVLFKICHDLDVERLGFSDPVAYCCACDKELKTGTRKCFFSDAYSLLLCSSHSVGVINREYIIDRRRDAKKVWTAPDVANFARAVFTMSSQVRSGISDHRKHKRAGVVREALHLPKQRRRENRSNKKP